VQSELKKLHIVPFESNAFAGEVLLDGDHAYVSSNFEFAKYGTILMWTRNLNGIVNRYGFADFVVQW
jgi:hypothetical protein